MSWTGHGRGYFNWTSFVATSLISISVMAAAPAAPSLLKAVPASPSEIQLSWQDNSSNELGFIVQRSTSSGSGYSQIARLSSNIKAFKDSGLSASRTYYYRVSAYNVKRSRYQYSANSNAASATTLAAPVPAPAPQPAPAPTPAPAPGAITVSNFTATSDVTNSYYSFNYTGTPEYFDVYLDTDNNASTGYPIAGIGAEFLVETAGNLHSILYRYTGTGGAWGWTTVKSVAFANNSTNLKNTVARADIGNPSSLKAVVQIDWLSSATSPVVSQSLSASQPAPAPGYVTYAKEFFGRKRTFNFDGSTAFVNPTIGQSDMEEFFYNAQYLAFDQITNSGASPWVTKVTDGGVPVTRYQVFPTDQQIWSWRSQAASFPFEMFKHYSYEIEFKMDPSWNLNMGAAGDGLFWQVKSGAKPGQYSNASMSLGITGNQMYFSILYPKTAENCSSWPCSVTWGNNDYLPTSFSRQTVVPGRYYKLRVEFFADDRPAKFGGQGYVKVYLDDQLWIQHQGPMLVPDAANPARFNFGWYNWGGQPTSTRIMYLRKNSLSVKP